MIRGFAAAFGEACAVAGTRDGWAGISGSAPAC
jgi:hypothetical protein